MTTNTSYVLLQGWHDYREVALSASIAVSASYAARALYVLGVSLAGIRERVMQLGGRLEIDTSSRGTKISVLLPLDRASFMAKTRILIADDHAVVRRGVRSILESQPGWEIVGEATTGREAVEQVRRLRPDVVVLGISLPELNGLEATRKIVKEAPRTKVLILTMHNSEEVTREILRAGARGVVLKSDADDTLVEAVRALRQHKPYLTSHAAEFVLDRYMSRGAEESESRAGHLTPREREVLQLVSEGKTNKEVASILSLSLYTVETHRGNILQKLNLHSGAELILYAVRKGVIS
jgi:DNA-binding NarL/FixJ family response regulator